MSQNSQRRKATMATATSPSFPGSRWDAVKPAIRQLYIDDDLTLPRVMAIMQEEHGFRATTRMYKFQLRKWGWKKYQNRTLMLAAQRLIEQLDRVGKPTVFKIGEHSFTDQQVANYFLRAPRYQPLKPVAEPSQELINTIKVFDAPLEGYGGAMSSPRSSSNTSTRTRDSGYSSVSPSLHYMKTHPLSPGVQASPVLPAQLRMPQMLFQTTREFLINSLHCNAWDLGPFDGSARSPLSKWSGTLANSIFNCFYELEHNHTKEAIGHLTKACGVTEQAVMENGPLLLATLVQTCLCYHDAWEKGLEMRKILFKYFRGWAMLSKSPTAASLQRWTRALLECANDKEAYFRLLRVQADTAAQQLGENHGLAIMLQIFCLNGLDLDASVLDWEALLLRCPVDSTYFFRVGTNLVESYLGKGQYEDVERISPNLSYLLSGDKWKDKKMVWVIALGKAQYELGKIEKATETLTRAADEVAGVRRTDHSFFEDVRRLRDLLYAINQYDAAMLVQQHIDQNNENLELAARAALEDLTIAEELKDNIPAT